MPTIKNYSAELGAVGSSAGRRAGAEDFGSQVGAAGEQLAASAAGAAESILRQKEADDARAMLTGIARLNAHYSTAQQEAIATGADLDKIRDQYADEMARLRGTSATKHGAATYDYQESIAMQAFDMRGLQIKAHRAGAQARKQADDYSSALGQQVFNDPSALPYLDGPLNDFIANLPPGLSPEQRADIKQEMVYRLNSDAVRGSMYIDAQQTLQDLQSGKWTLKPGQLAQEIARAKTQIDADANQAWVMKQRQLTESRQLAEEKTDVYLQQIFNGKMDPKVVNLDPTFSAFPDLRKSLITFNRSWWDENEGGGKKSNPVVLRDMWLRVHAEEDDPTKIMVSGPVLQAVQRGELTTKDAQRLLQDVALQRDPNYSSFAGQFGAAERRLNDAFARDIRYQYGGGPLKAAEIVNRWSGEARSIIAERRKAGEPLSELLDPTSKHYLLSPEFVRKHQRAAELAAPVPSVPGGPRAPAVGDELAFPDGKTRRYKGGDPLAIDSSWELVEK